MLLDRRARGLAEALGQLSIDEHGDRRVRERIEHGARATVEQRFAAPVVARQVAALYTDAASASASESGRL